MAKMHVVAYSESKDPAGAFVNIAPVSDDTTTTSGNDLIVPREVNKLLGACAFATATGNEVKLESPSLRRVNNFRVTPVHLVAAGVVDTGPKIFFPEAILSLQTDEALECKSDAATTGGLHQIGVWLCDEAPAPVSGEIYTCRFDRASYTAAVGVWNSGQLTLADKLPVGQYDVVGGRVIHLHSTFFRLNFKGQPWFPGGLVLDDVGALDPPLQRHGGLGVWGSFDTTNIPNIELLGHAASAAAAIVYLDLIRKG